jgi:tetratricopeptide (TPR) repeat protein
MILLAAGNAALGEQMIEHFDRQAQSAAVNGDWPSAIRLWEVARQILNMAGSSLGSPRPILHKLALAYEAQEQWVEAAELWRVLLRTRPRQIAGQSQSPDGTVSPDGNQLATTSNSWGDKQWSWVRKRVIECYKRAQQPGEAVSVFRQAIKAEPHDIDLRLQFVEALIANDQVQAAYNELYRIVDLDPKHVEANFRLSYMESEGGAWYAAEQRIRKLVEYYPDREDVRLHLAKLLLNSAELWHERGMFPQAIEKLEEGQKLAPKDFSFPLWLARVTIDQRDLSRAPAFLEQALELSTDQPKAYINIIDCWVALDKMEEVKTILTKAEAALSPDPTFYVDLAMTILKRKTERPLFNPFFGPPPKQAPPTDTPWSKLAVEIMQRASALRPNDVPLQSTIATALAMVRPDLALPFAREVVRLQPDDPHAGMLLGLVLGLSDQGREAKEVLRKAARQARQQGDMGLFSQIEAMRQQIDSPLFKMLPNLGSMMDIFGDDDDDDDDDDDFLF